MPIGEYSGGNVGDVGFGYHDDPKPAMTPFGVEPDDFDDGPAGIVTKPSVPGPGETYPAN